MVQQLQRSDHHMYLQVSNDSTILYLSLLIHYFDSFNICEFMFDYVH